MAYPFFVTIPHSGESVPDFCDWLHQLPETHLMCDVDRFVNRLYEPSLQKLNVPWIQTQWHRYAADLNRFSHDIDASSVEGCSTPAGTHPKGFHWVVTTTGLPLLKKPISQKTHQDLIDLIFTPFHQKVESQYQILKSSGHRQIYHLDVHSMPSVGTKMHRDPGEKRTDIVISDSYGKTSGPEFVDLVIAAYAKAGFKVGYNWPYAAGRVSEHYGQPQNGQHAVQVELSRALYMDESSKHLNEKSHVDVQIKIEKALGYIIENLKHLDRGT